MCIYYVFVLPKSQTAAIARIDPLKNVTFIIFASRHVARGAIIFERRKRTSNITQSFPRLRTGLHVRLCIYVRITLVSTLTNLRVQLSPWLMDWYSLSLVRSFSIRDGLKVDYVSILGRILYLVLNYFYLNVCFIY